MLLLSSLLLLPLLAAPPALCAPAYPQLSTSAAAQARGLDILSNYFNLLAKKAAAYQFGPAALSCDLSAVQLPRTPSPLPGPSAGLTLSHIAVGRGTQNYTCGADPTAAPVATGAVATLFNASCIAAAFPELLKILPAVALQFSLVLGTAASAEAAAADAVGPTEMLVSGRHFFTAGGSPFFDLSQTSPGLGGARCAKLNATDAPDGAPAGPNGEPAVPWLKLKAVEQTGAVREVYRVDTAGGSAPATCKGMQADFVVPYASLYWFYEGAPQ